MITELLLGVLMIVLISLWAMANRDKGNIPGVTGWPLIGSLPDTNRTLTSQVMEMSKKYGKIFKWRQGTWDIIFLTDHKMIKEVLQNASTAFRPEFHSFQKMSSNFNGLLFSNGSVWHSGRRFALRNMRDFGMGKSSMSECILDEAKHLVYNLKKSKGIPTTVSQALNIAVINVIWKIVADRRYELDDPEFAKYVGYVGDTVKGLERNQVFDIMPWITKIVPKSICDAIVGESKFENAISELKKFHKTIIDEHRQTLDATNPRDYIDTFLIEAENEKNNSEKFSDENLMTHILDLFSAGSETTSTTLRWFILLLASYPNVQRKMQEEIDKVLGSDTTPSLEDKERLPYTNAVIAETTRFATIVPSALPHLAVEDIQVSGYTIPKGSLIFPHIESIHKDPNTWEKPSEFYPAHFLTAEGKFRKREELIPFSVGRRSCIGESLARLELFLFASSLVQKLNFSFPPGVKGDLRSFEATRIINLPRPYDVIVTERQ